MRRADLYGGAGLFLSGLAMLFVVIPAESEGPTWSGVSPLFFPTIMMAGLTVFSGALFLQALLRPMSYPDGEAPLPLERVMFFLIASAIILGAVLLIHAVGLLYAGPVLIGGLMLYMGERRWHVILPLSIAPPVATYFFVTKVLNAPLP